MSQSTTKKQQASLESFFKSAQPASISVTPSSQPASAVFKAPPSNFPHPAFTGPRANSREAIPGNSTVARSSTAAPQKSYTSSLSLPPSSPTALYEIPISPPEPAVPSSAPGRVVRSSDDEDEDSESSLEDLAVLFHPNHSANRPKPAPNGVSPSTPTTSRSRNVNFLKSPMPVLTKHKFDLKSLATDAELDRRTEASSKRVKAMQEASQKKENAPSRSSDASEKLKHSSLLQDVVAGHEGGDVNKVARAVMRTEATLSEQRCYFFDTQANPPKHQRKPFPTKSISEDWQHDLKDTQMRHQTFVSGFAEDMVSFGKALPDEIILWMFDEICVESSEPLRASYCNVLKQSPEQVERLLGPNIIRKMFERVGATSATTATTDKIRTVQALTEPYAKRDWSKLRSLIRLFGQIANSLQPRNYIITLLLRMSVDRVVKENVDIFDLVQETISRLCRYVPAGTWESCCQTICTSLFKCVDQPTLRLQMVECTPSMSPRTHDLKRRLAMSFYFNNLTYSTQHSHHLMDLDKVINRLFSPDFEMNKQTDFRELAALISLLDIAVDDGRTFGQDLTDLKTAKKFDKHVDELGDEVKHFMRDIGNPGAAFISRIEAKEVIDCVSQRISDTLRSKPKAKITVFDQKQLDELRKRADRELKDQETVGKQKKLMESIFVKEKVANDNSNGQTSFEDGSAS